jgi:hypothetical protein
MKLQPETSDQIRIVNPSQALVAFELPRPYLLDEPMYIRLYRGELYRLVKDGEDGFSGNPVTALEPDTTPTTARAYIMIDGLLWIRCSEPGYRVRSINGRVTLVAELLTEDDIDGRTGFSANDFLEARRSATMAAIEQYQHNEVAAIHSVPQITVIAETMVTLMSVAQRRQHLAAGMDLVAGDMARLLSGKPTTSQKFQASTLAQVLRGNVQHLKG